MKSYATEDIQSLHFPEKVTTQQGVPRGLLGPLAGRGVSPHFLLNPPPKAAQAKRNLSSYDRLIDVNLTKMGIKRSARSIIVGNEY